MAQKYENFIDELSFKPKLNKNSLFMASKLKRKSSNLIYNIYFYEDEDKSEREVINKFKIKLKPAMSNVYNLSEHMPYLNKRNHGLKRTLSEIIINKKKEKYSLTKKINKNNKINYKLEEKKFDNYFTKKQKINDDNASKIKKMKNIKESENFNNLMKKINLLNNENENSKENPKPELYKLNIRKGSAWNQDVINEIIIDNKYDEFIKKEFL